MLLDIDSRPGGVKQIAVAMRSDAVTEFLCHLLELWQFEICEPSDSSVLLLAEKGSAEPLAGQGVIWLNAETDGGELGFSLPIEPESFWQALEQRFHKPPRRHIRLSLALHAEVVVGDDRTETVVTSLSDMGCRFSFHRELVRGEQLTLCLEVEGESLRIDGEVIYSMPVSAVSTGEVRAGALFSGIEAVQREHVRAFLIRSYLEEVRCRMAPERFAEALQSLDISGEVRAGLAG